MTPEDKDLEHDEHTDTDDETIDAELAKANAAKEAKKKAPPPSAAGSQTHHGLKPFPVVEYDQHTNNTGR